MLMIVNAGATKMKKFWQISSFAKNEILIVYMRVGKRIFAHGHNILKKIRKRNRKMKKVIIGLVQIKAEINKPGENLARITHYVKLAKEKKVDIICFPELCISGYHRELALEIAEDIQGDRILAVSRLARDSGITILAGAAEKNSQGKPFITHLVFFPDGKIDKYQKTHLGHSEKNFFAAGNELLVFQTEKIKFGIQICWELHFPEITTILALKGCELIFAPHASPIGGTERKELWLKYLTARAYDNSIYVAACNLVGADGIKQDFGGGALIIDPKGRVISEFFDQEEGMITASLEPDLINAIRTERQKSMRNSFYLSARRPELYGEITKGVKVCLSAKD
jgi:predicted amidohydrolase